MREVTTINKIRDATNSIKEKLTTLNCNQYLEQSFGSEDEYTCKELYTELDEILTDITTLTKRPKQFLKLSDYQERNNIYNQLNDMHDYLEDPNNVASLLDSLKILVRQFHIKYTNDRFVEFDEELSKLTDKKQIFSSELKKLEDSLNKTLENEEQSKNILEDLTQQQRKLSNFIDSIKLKESHMGQEIRHLSTQSKHISQLEVQVLNKKEIIDSFVKKIINREQELEGQTVKTNAFNEKLEEFTSQRDELINSAHDLIKEAKTALGYKKAEGIAAAFRNRLQKLEPEEGNIWKKLFSPSIWWLVGSAIFVIAAIFLSKDFVEVLKNKENITIAFVLARLSIIALPITGAWFCAGQYTKIKNIAEDYAYKTVLAESIIGFSEHLKSEDETDKSYQNYMQKMLDELHNHPLKNHKKQEESAIHNNFLNKIEAIIKSNKNDGVS
ncbi:hypothetical protein [uncultured Gammaproteobacteria bacterium]|jgi:hypothetical protein|nr:hypothetical protein [uncultured Gammaproteobacteria bacterium]CAC9561841.1 hypothetical protein [uncultured Gammaproteobacteria bacterium]CAC9575974.1 hypothetical protein [uncultured Gammaproteobacteria bacterium]